MRTNSHIFMVIILITILINFFNILKHVDIYPQGYNLNILHVCFKHVYAFHLCLICNCCYCNEKLLKLWLFGIYISSLTGHYCMAKSAAQFLVILPNWAFISMRIFSFLIFFVVFISGRGKIFFREVSFQSQEILSDLYEIIYNSIIFYTRYYKPGHFIYSTWHFRLLNFSQTMCNTSNSQLAPKLGSTRGGAGGSSTGRCPIQGFSLWQHFVHNWSGGKESGGVVTAFGHTWIDTVGEQNQTHIIY